MAVETHTIAGIGEVTIDFTGTLVKKQTGGPAGAFHLEDDNGPVNVNITGVGNGQVFSALNSAALDTLVTTFNAP